jgi:hypothetical protein
MLRVSRQSLYSRMQAEPALQEARVETRYGLRDDLGLKLVEKALAGEPWAVRTFLKRSGGFRSW